MTLHSPTENSLAVLIHKILEVNSQVQNVKLGGHQTCLSINRLWYELCDMLRRFVGTTAPDIMIVQFRNEKVSNHGSIPITIDCNVVAFIVFEVRRIPPAHKAHQTLSALNSHRGVSSLMKLAKGEDRWKASDHVQGILPQNWGGTPSIATNCRRATHGKFNFRNRQTAWIFKVDSQKYTKNNKTRDKKTSDLAKCKGQLALTVRGERRLRRIVRNLRSQTVAQIATQLNDSASVTVSKRTVKRSLHLMDFGSSRLTRIPLLNAHHRAARLA
ncbi:HTH_Tnp_Tc3_2 domain-containing protein [Trichonephila clavipes]|nr:HTH_Tnp_Tc3_2 domain-containing protein [Trichonephila clavipes]